MAEKITLQNFKYGLDARRSELTSQPGTLVTCQNGHINQGGEIEKRLAFVLFETVAILDSLADTGVFGMEGTDSGVMVFGSAIVFGGTVTLGQPTLASAIPVTSPLTVYQQLQHPAVLDGATYDRTIHRMTQVVFSTTFKGKAFVIAKFADGYTFTYYNGSLIQQSRNGLVLTGQNNLTALGRELAREFNAISGWGPTNGSFTAVVAASARTVSGAGTGATVTTTVVLGVVTAAVIVAGGSGYVNGDNIAVRDVSGFDIYLSVATTSGGAILTLTILNSRPTGVNGDYYLTLGTAYATVALTGAGSGATITLQATSGSVSGSLVTIAAAGTGYAVGDLVMVRDQGGTGVIIKVASLAGSGIATATLVYTGQGTLLGVDIVEAPMGTTFIPVTSKVSVAGLLGSSGINQNAPGFGATAARIGFTLNAGTNGTVTVTAPQNSDGSGTVTLASAIAFRSTLTITASDIATAINNQTPFTGYSASSTGAVVTVIAPTSFGAVTFNISVTTTGDITTAAGAVASGVAVTLSGTFSKTRVGKGTAIVSTTISAAGSGGTSPYTFAWAESVSGSGNGITIGSAAGVSCAFSKSLIIGADVQGTFKCTITDNVSATAVVFFTIDLSNESNL